MTGHGLARGKARDAGEDGWVMVECGWAINFLADSGPLWPPLPVLVVRNRLIKVPYPIR